MIIILVLMFIIPLKGQSNPECKAKRYQCAKETLEPNICAFVEDAQEKFNYLQVCPEDTPHCPYQTAKYGLNAKCTSQTASKELIPGDECKDNDECLSGKCEDQICKGKSETEDCEHHSDCDPGNFCNEENVCEPLREFDQACVETYQCVNNCTCNNNKCTFYYSVGIGVLADTADACFSGYLKDGKCENALQSRFHGQPCTYDEDCQYINDDQEVIEHGICTCGFNAGAFSYCPLAQGDPEFLAYLRAFQFILLGNIECHTLRRFGPCKYIESAIYREYLMALKLYVDFPKLMMNDDCIAKIINWDYWKYHLSTQYILKSLISISLIIFMLY